MWFLEQPLAAERENNRSYILAALTYQVQPIPSRANHTKAAASSKRPVQPSRLRPAGPRNRRPGAPSQLVPQSNAPFTHHRGRNGQTTRGNVPSFGGTFTD